MDENKETMMENNENVTEEGTSTAAKAGIIGGIAAAGVGAFLGVRAAVHKVKKTRELAKLYLEEHPEAGKEEPKKEKPKKEKATKPSKEDELVAKILLALEAKDTLKKEEEEKEKEEKPE